MRLRDFIGAAGLWPLAAARAVLATCAMVTPLGWLVCVELPTEKAKAPAQCKLKRPRVDEVIE